MKENHFIFICLLLLLMGCGKRHATLSEGHIVYNVDYPKQRSNFFLYGILPKEMTVYFKNNQTLSIIKKANLENRIFVDCSDHSFKTQFIYANQSAHADLTPRELQLLREKQPKYSLKYTNNTQELLGCEAHEVIATSMSNPTDKVVLWYTKDIDIDGANWYNPFHEIDGVLLQYAIDRYGMRMIFTAKEISKSPIEANKFNWKPSGKKINYSAYNQRIAQLFQSFE